MVTTPRAELQRRSPRRRPSRGSASATASSTCRRHDGSRSPAARRSSSSPASSSTATTRAAAGEPRHDVGSSEPERGRRAAPSGGAAQDRPEEVCRDGHPPARGAGPLAERADAGQHRLASRGPGRAHRGDRGHGQPQREGDDGGSLLARCSSSGGAPGRPSYRLGGRAGCRLAAARGGSYRLGCPGWIPAPSSSRSTRRVVASASAPLRPPGPACRRRARGRGPPRRRRRPGP